MQPNYSSLGNEAFGPDATALITVKYQSHQDAVTFLLSSLRQPNGVGLLYGPLGAGKTTIVRELSGQLGHDAAVAHVDGARIKPRELLKSILSQFDVETSVQSDDEMLQMINAFSAQLTRTFQSPILIIDNVDRMYPSSLRILNALAALEVGGRFVLRIVLTGHEALKTLVDSAGMKNIATRNPGLFSLGPLSAKETMIYLHARLQAAGSERADTVFPFDVCDSLREQSGGWPGLLNLFALEAMERARDFPISVADTREPDTQADLPVADIPVLATSQAVSPVPPRIVITRDGKTVTDYTVNDKKVLIGRSDFADIVIDDDFVSKMHVVLLLFSDALVLLDLNSANGTTVNSVRTRKTILKNDDVISLGNHRLKVTNAPAISEEMETLLKTPDTLKMKSLIDLRRLRARRRTKAAANHKLH